MKSSDYVTMATYIMKRSHENIALQDFREQIQDAILGQIMSTIINSVVDVFPLICGNALYILFSTGIKRPVSCALHFTSTICVVCRAAVYKYL